MAISRLGLAAALLTGAFAYFVAKLVSHRRFYRKHPGPPHSWLWGHLKIMGEYSSRMPPGGYIHHPLTQMQRDYNLPPNFYLDLWPAGPSMLIVTDPDLAAVATTTNNYPMHSAVIDFFIGNTGTTFIEATNGALWKELFQQIAPALTPTAAKAFHHRVVDHAVSLHHSLRRYTEAPSDLQQIADLTKEVGRYPFHVISSVVFGADLSEEAYQCTNRLVKLFNIKGTPLALANPLALWRWTREKNAIIDQLGTEIEGLIRARYALLQANGGKPPAGMPPAVMDRMLFPKVLKGKPLDAEHMRILLENGKGFIIAGFGTTTDTSVYVWNLLATHPEVLEKVREEHTRVFGKGFERTVELLHEQPSILNSLEYTTAVINETLRLFPVGMVGRGAPENITALEHNGTSHPLQDKIMIGILSHSMHYNPDIFENPDQFRPERFLGEAAAAIPRSAYRPFEQGPRGCVGKALAMDEMRIALALVSRFFDFELIDHEPRKEPTYSHMSLDSKLGKHAFQVHAFTAMPAGPVKMRIDLVDE